VLYHEGNGLGTTNRIVLLPDEGVGFFTSVNTEAIRGMGDPSVQTTFVRELHEAIIDTFYPGPGAGSQDQGPLLAAGSGVPRDPADGMLIPTRVDEASVLHLEALVSQTPIARTDGGLSLDGIRHVRESTGVFRSESGGAVFLEGRDGTLYATRGGTAGYREMRWWESVPLNGGVLVTALLSLVVGAAVAVRRSSRSVRVMVVLTLISGLGFVTLLAYGVATLEILDLFTGVPAPLVAAQLAATACLVTAVALRVILRGESGSSGWRRAGAILVSVGGLTLGIWASVWDVVPF
jgi:hypothetical protein